MCICASVPRHDRHDLLDRHASDCRRVLVDVSVHTLSSNHLRGTFICAQTSHSVPAVQITPVLESRLGPRMEVTPASQPRSRSILCDGTDALIQSCRINDQLCCNTDRTCRVVINTRKHILLMVVNQRPSAASTLVSSTAPRLQPARRHLTPELEPQNPGSNSSNNLSTTIISSEPRPKRNSTDASFTLTQAAVLRLSRTSFSSASHGVYQR